jgi:purine-binding chemotaxis protein CheW
MSDLLNPHQCLQNYFDDLLQEEPVPPVPAPAPVKNEPASVLTDYAELERAAEQERQEKLQRLLQSARPQLVTSPVEEIQEWDIGSPEIPAELPAAPDLEVQAQEPAPSADSPLVEGLEWMPNGRPSWAQTRFDVLLFKVSGLTLAVPLMALGQIQPITEELTPLFGQADWFMGLQPTPAGKIRTVNTAKFVMPERYDENFVKTARYVVSINGVPWGLAVDSVNQPISLEPEDVKWRSERSKRPWLAGTVKEHMCALLDIPRFGQLLLDADRNWSGNARR